MTDAEVDDVAAELVYLTGPPPTQGPRVPFVCPNVHSVSNMWGPAGPAARVYEDMPYQPFSKADRLGKAADITGTAFQSRGNRFQSMFGAGDAYGYYDESGEKSFSLVHSKKKPEGFFQRRKWQNRTSRRDLFAARDDRRLAGMGMQTLSKAAKNRDRDRSRLERRYQKRWAGRRRFTPRAEAVERQASVDIKSSWQILEEMDLGRLAKLSIDVAAPKDLLTCGELKFYDKGFDRVTVKQERTVPGTNKAFHNVTTTDDPNIRELAKGEANVFATDAILAAIMCCNRSVYSWDIVAQRVGDKIFLDKRDDSDFDFLTVNETSHAPPTADTDSIDAPERLSMEATYLNRTVSQQVLQQKTPGYKFPSANPFTDEEEGEDASVGYRYRQWNIGTGIKLVARTEHDAVYKDKEGRTGFMNIKTMNEWKPDPKMDWRNKLDTQRGAVLATELKNNACKIARWTISSMLAGSSKLQLAYVSRANPADNRQHKILGTQAFKPKDLAAQVNLNLKNGWAILKTLVESIMKYEPGKFVVIKDPNKAVLRIYSVPANTFDSDDDSDDDEDGLGVRLPSDDGEMPNMMNA